MKANLRLALVWAALLGGLVFVFRKVPKAGLDLPAPSVLPATPPSAPLEGAQERYARGVMAADRGDDPEARELFEEALRRDPALAAAHVQLAVLSARARAPEAEILSHLQRARDAGFDRDAALGRIDRLLSGDLTEEGLERLALQREILLKIPPPPGR